MSCVLAVAAACSGGSVDINRCTGLNLSPVVAADFEVCSGNYWRCSIFPVDTSSLIAQNLPFVKDKVASAVLFSRKQYAEDLD